MYIIKRCNVCGSFIHVHKIDNHYVFKNIVCEHIPNKDRFTTRDVDTYLR